MREVAPRFKAGDVIIDETYKPLKITAVGLIFYLHTVEDLEKGRI